MAAAVPLAAQTTSPASRTKNVAIFFPGIMGSVLRNPSDRKEIWSNDLAQTLTTLLARANNLTTPADPVDVLDEAHFQSVLLPDFLSSSKIFYKDILYLLANHPAFRGPDGGFLPFAYDWRQSCDDAIQGLRETLKAKYGLRYSSTPASNGKAATEAARQTGFRFHLVGHSMGAILVLLVISQNVIHPDDVGSAFLIAPPISGSPRAFESLFSGVPSPLDGSLPVCFYCQYLPNGRKAVERLRSSLRQMQSIYELMPPPEYPYVEKSTSFLWNPQQLPGARGNPLEGNILDQDMRNRAIAFHERLTAAIRELEKRIQGARASKIDRFPAKNFHLLYADEVPTDAVYYAKETKDSAGRPGYKIVDGIEQEGDGTVLSQSALGCIRTKPCFGNSLKFPEPQRFGNVQHAEICSDARVLDYIKKFLPVA
jgi:pimeloyl-ACP methyl ester carboxylesterase